jgi:HK97 family phage portal protein
MAIIDNILKPFGLQRTKANLPQKVEQRSSSLKNPLSWLLSGSLGAINDINVNRQTALSISAVYRAVNLISGIIASLPFEVYAGREKLSNSQVDKLINKKPNGWQNGYSFKKLIAVHLLIDGNAYVLNQNGMLTVLDYRQVTPYLVNGEKFYQVNGISGVLTNDEVLHFYGLSFGPDTLQAGNSYDMNLKGMSPISTAYGVFSGGIAEGEFSNQFFSNGVNPSGVVEHPDTLKDDQYERLKGSFAKSYGGVANTGKVPVLEEGAKFKPITINPKDAMLIEKKKLTVDDIARIYDVPPPLLYNLENTKYSNLEGLSTEFVRYGIKPKVELLEAKFTSKLLPDNQEVKADFETLLRGDSVARAQYYKDMFFTGAMSPNEIIEREGGQPYAGGEQHFIQSNMMVVKPNMPSPFGEENNSSDE